MSLSIFTCNSKVAFPSGASPSASIFYGHRPKVLAVAASCRNNTRTTMCIAIRTYTIYGENTERDVTTMAVETGYHKSTHMVRSRLEISYIGTITMDQCHQTRNGNHHKEPRDIATKQTPEHKPTKLPWDYPKYTHHDKIQAEIPNIIPRQGTHATKHETESITRNQGT